MTSGIGVVRVWAREKDSALEGLENVGPDDVDGLDKDVGPEDVEDLENEVNDGAEGGANEDWGLAACITQLAPLSWVKLFLHSCFWKYGKWQLILHKRRWPSSIQINTRWLLLNIEDPGLWHKYFLKSSFLIFFSNNLIDLATQYNWILTPFQINFQGLTVNFVGEMEDLGSYGQQTIQKGFVAACNIILYQISGNWKEILVNVLQTPGPAHTHTADVLCHPSINIINRELMTHTIVPVTWHSRGALAHLLSESGISIVCQRGLFSWYHDAHCSTEQ